MKLNKNQYVVFEDGTMEGYMEVKYSESKGAFYKVATITDEDGYTERVKMYSTTVIAKESKKSKFTPNAKNCTVEIHPVYETEKAYAVSNGNNGCVSKGNRKDFYKFIAKSICYTENNKIYAPMWA